jgi:hypothetical protein
VILVSFRGDHMREVSPWHLVRRDRCETDVGAAQSGVLERVERARRRKTPLDAPTPHTDHGSGAGEGRMVRVAVIVPGEFINRALRA